jgi:hypothetical protein
LNLDNSIQNVGECYSARYLAEQFTKEIGDQGKTWKSHGSQSVLRRIQAASRRTGNGDADEPVTACGAFHGKPLPIPTQQHTASRHSSSMWPKCNR